MSGIVCLGWGSLIWRPENLKLKYRERPWYTDGPSLPIEFARKSNNGSITLVLAPQSEAVPVLWAYLDVPNLKAARGNLSARESETGNPDKVVGVWSADHAEVSLHSELIAEWAKSKGFDGVVWTKLPANFPERGTFPTQEQVIGYLSSLDGDEKAMAQEYVQRTPRQVATQYRAAIQQRFGWKYDGSLTDKQIRYPNGCLTFGIGH